MEIEESEEIINPVVEAASKRESHEMLFLAVILLGDYVFELPFIFIQTPRLSIAGLFSHSIWMGGMSLFWVLKYQKTSGYFRYSKRPYLLGFLQLIFIAVAILLCFVPTGRETSVHAMSIRVLFIIMSVVSAPLVEEFFFRGLLFNHLRSNFGNLIAIALTSVMFGMIHIPRGSFLLFFFFSIAMCLVVIIFKNIILPITIHSLWNAHLYIWSSPSVVPLALSLVVALTILLMVLGILRRRSPDSVGTCTTHN
jgi:membrane protease YdiL (CAAX protease family)